MSSYSVSGVLFLNDGGMSTITCKIGNKSCTLCSGTIDKGTTSKSDERVCGIGEEFDRNFVEVRGPSLDRH